MVNIICFSCPDYHQVLELLALQLLDYGFQSISLTDGNQFIKHIYTQIYRIDKCVRLKVFDSVKCQVVELSSLELFKMRLAAFWMCFGNIIYA